MKKFFIFLMLCCLVSATFAQTIKAKAVKTSAPNDTTSYYSFKDAVDFLNNNGDGTVFVCADDASTGAIYIKKKITILPYNGGTYTITRANTYTRSLFSIEANSDAELILGNENPTDAGTLTISGNNVTTNPTTLFYIKNKTTFRNGVILQDNYASDVNDSNMSGAITIDANGSDENGEFKGELHITGNTIIQSNHITYNAPIIRVSLKGKFYMENGTIQTNDATLGTIIGGLGNNSIIEITGGTIQNNAYKHDANNAAIKTAANNYALGGSVSIQDTIMGDKQIKVLSNLTNHNANNPIVVKVNYTGERQLLIGDSATVANNFFKFKPIDVNGNPVCISMDGKLINATYIVYIDGSSTPNAFYTLAQVTDFINSNASTSALIDIQGDDNMIYIPSISKNISVTIQAINGKHTIRQVSQHSSNLLYTQYATITFRSKTSTDTLILDGSGLEASILYFSENSNASLQGNVFIENYDYDDPVITVDNSTLKVNSGTTFRNNTGDYGIIGAFNNSNVIIDGGVFTNNSFNKPLVYSVDYDSLRITGGTFSNNSTPTGSQFGAIGNICETSCSNDNRFYSIGGSVSITDTIASNSCDIEYGTVQAPLKIKVNSNLTNHSANNPILVKVNYAGERQLLIADIANLIACNYMKFKPVDVNGKQVRITNTGMLTDKWPIYSVKAGTTDTLGHLSLKEAVDTLNQYNNGGIVLACANDTVKQTVTIEKNITILPYKANCTFYRGDTLKHQTSPLINVISGAQLNLGAATDTDTLTFEGRYMTQNYASLIENYGTIDLAGNVVMQNNYAGWQTKSGAAIFNKDSLAITGNALFQGNYSYQYCGAICNAQNTARMLVSGNVEFLNNTARLGAGALGIQNGTKVTFTETSDVQFTGNRSNNGGAICVHYGANLAINGDCAFTKNVASTGASFTNGGNTIINGYTTVIGDTSYNKGVIVSSSGTLEINNGEITGNVLYIDSADTDNGIIVMNHYLTHLNGSNIHHNIFVNRTGSTLNPLPASVVISATNTQYIIMSDSVVVDTITLLLSKKNQQIRLSGNLTKVTDANPIVLQLDSLDKQVLKHNNGGNDIANLIANNYRKFKPAADTLTINQNGWVVRKPQISINGIYMLQAMTKFSDYGITTANPDSIVGNDMIYVAYTQKVDAHGNANTTKSDSTILEMNVTCGGATSHIRQNIAGQENGSYNYTIPFNSSLWDVQPSAGVLNSGNYHIEIDTLIVHTIGVSAGTGFSLDKNVNIPHITIDTLNFLLAGTRFSDYHYCSVGATTNDGDGADVVPGNEIYVEYTRTCEIDTAYVMVAIKGNGQNVVYREGTPAGTHFGVGCGSFRTFLDKTGIGQFVESSDLSTPATLALEDDSTYLCLATIRVKAAGEPYFTVGTKFFNYTHNIDREVVYALDTFSGRNVNYNNIGITLTRTGDSLALNYPSAFSVAKARELGMVGTDNRIYVVLTADPEDTTIRVAPTSPAMLLADNNALNATNYTNIFGTQGGKFLKAVCISKEIQAGDVVVSALNFDSGESELTWTCAIGENTGIHNPYNTYRTLYKLTGNTAHDTTNVAHNQMSYRNTGVSGVKLHASSGQASYMFHPEDYTVWPTQDPTPGLDLNNKVWLALYVSAPNANVKKVYNPALNTPFSTNADSVVTLQDAPAKRVTATEAVNYYPVGTCADYATKDYTFFHTGDAPYLNNYLYWFDENEKLLSVQKYNVAVKRAPTYTVKYNFNGGGAHCNAAYPANYGDTTYIFGRKITRPANPYKCGNLFMDWYEGNNQFLTVDSFQNVRSGEAFGIRANHNLDAHWQYFVTLSNPHDTAVIADYSLCDINTRSYVWEPTETTFPYVYTFHTDYLGNYYRDYTENTTNCNVRFDANAFTENPVTLPVGQTSQVTWTYTDMCNTTFTISQNVNVKFPPCGADNYNPHLYPFTPYVDSTYKAMDANGNLYETVRMGCDCWTKENLKTLNYAQDNSAVAIAKAYLNEEANADIYGRLYTWYSAVKLPEGSTETTIPVNADNKPQGVCPTGWYLPSEDDFNRMNNLSNIDGTSSTIKEEGVNDYWLGNETGNNATGFTALPAGFYDSSTNRYSNLLGDGYFWTSSSTSTVNAPCCALTHSCPVILITDNNKGYGYSVRCIKYKKFDY